MIFSPATIVTGFASSAAILFSAIIVLSEICPISKSSIEKLATVSLVVTLAKTSATIAT